MPALASSTVSSDGLFILHLQLVDDLEMRRRQVPDGPLLLHDAAFRVDDLEPVLLHDPIVLVEDLALEQPEALRRVDAPPEVHAGFVELELDAPRHEPVERDFDWYPEIER